MKQRLLVTGNILDKKFLLPNLLNLLKLKPTFDRGTLEWRNNSSL